MMGCIVVYTTQCIDIESVGSNVSQATFPFPCSQLYFKMSLFPVVAGAAVFLQGLG